MDKRLKSLMILNKVCSNAYTVWKKLEALGVSDGLSEGDSGGLLEAASNERAAARFATALRAGWAEKEYESSLKMGIRVISYLDPDYPHNLFALQEPPAVLYIRGALKRLPEKNVSIVGTRRATRYGIQTARKIGFECARRGLCVVSGGASGIDGAAHDGSLSGGGKTVAVMGTGADIVFPSVHAELFDRIKQQGMLISEFPLGTKGLAWNFPRRNRIVASLSHRTVIVEAPQKSGAMITARLALELGREVWAVPGRIDENVAEGTNALIFDGAQPLISVEHFFGPEISQTPLFDSAENEDNPSGAYGIMTDIERTVLENLKLSGDKTVDNIANEVKMSAAEVMKIIAVLSASGAVYRSGPGRFSAVL